MTTFIDLLTSLEKALETESCRQKAGHVITRADHDGIKDLTLDWRKAYFDIGENHHLIEQCQYNRLMKISEHTTTVFDSLKKSNLVDKHYTADFGQLKRAVLNVLALYDTQFGNCTVIQTAFVPTAEFWNLGVSATKNINTQPAKSGSAAEGVTWPEPNHSSTA